MILVFLICFLVFVSPAQGYEVSTTWQPGWTRYYFPSPPGDSTPEFITRRVQLPTNVLQGDLILIFTSDEFDNETRWTSYNTNFFGSCELVRSASTNGPWTVIQYGVGSNFDARMHHWPYQSGGMFIASSTTASDYIAVRCWFARNIQTRDPLYDFIEANTDYGWIKTAIIAREALR